MPTIELTAADGHLLSAHRSDPEGTPLGGVVVIQEIFGVNDHIRSVADRFAAAGYLAVAPALFDRVERGAELAYDASGAEKGKELAWNLPIDQPLADLTATAELLADAVGGPGAVATVGFCYGGMLSAAMASRRARHLGAAVAYYPSMAAQLLVKDQPHIPLLVHLGELDPRVTPADGEALAARWPGAVFRSYPAGHGFDCDRRPAHHPEASAQAWEHTVRFLQTNLEGGA
ncbi:MAG: carboxymethylenebutenolidase [Ilumatobacteraceae bacterium]|nr:carboxymethylenebutenolidase [Ilumatobacteraceae bacterium]